MVPYGETSGSTDEATLMYWAVGLTVLVAFLSAVWFLGTLQIDHDVLDHDPLIESDADTMSYTDISRLPVRMYRGSSSSETPALTGSQGDFASSILSDLPSANRALTVFNEVELTCAVCQQQVLHLEVVKTLPCMHQFHSECIDKWLRENPKPYCPLCRNRVKLAQPFLPLCE